jgi:hypothetical protein
MKSELTIFGRRLNMTPRSNRRLFVGSLYGSLAYLIAWSWIINSKRIRGRVPGD